MRPRRAPGLDFERATRSTNDGELAPLRIVGQVGADTDVHLKITGWNATRVRVLDARRQPVTPPAHLRFHNQYPLRVDARPLTLHLEIGTLAGSPASHPATLSTSHRRRGPGAPRGIDERTLTVELVEYPAAGDPQRGDAGSFVIAPVLLPDNGATAVELFIAEAGPSPRRTRLGQQASGPPENEPTLTEVNAAGRMARVAVRRVPLDVSGGDSWLQDQYQVGYCQGPADWTWVVVHLPRLRSDVAWGQSAPNLSRFVRTHFPSRDVGVFDDFWKRVVPVTDADGQVVGIPFADSDLPFLVLRWLVNLHATLGVELLRLGQAVPVAGGDSDVASARRELRDLLARLSSATTASAERATEDAQRHLLRQREDDLRTQVERVEQLVIADDDTVEIDLGAAANSPLGGPSGGSRSTGLPATIKLTDDTITQLYQRLRQLHASENAGGNLEAGPAVPRAPHGTVIIGNTTSADGDLADPDLLRLLEQQQTQPLIELDTSWLWVGHVDEVVTFVPARDGHALLHAAPDLAVDILEAAARRYRSGLPTGHPQEVPFRPSGILPRATKAGQHPVTHLLRGCDWLHVHPPRGAPVIEPPRMYRRMAGADARWGWYRQGIEYTPGGGPNRMYPANLSVFEALYFEGGTNRRLARDRVAPMLAELRRTYGSVPVVGLPVLFDSVDHPESPTVAFTPDLVNLQVLGDHLLIPRPHGPRMRVDDAIAVLSDIVPAASRSRLNRRFLTRRTPERPRGLDHLEVWLEEPVNFNGSVSDAAEITSRFRDGRPDLNAEEYRRELLRRNRRRFQGSELRDGWQHVVIPEPTVDLFEAYTEVALAPLGVRVHWVESWFYHLRLGELHCGTNVLRRPRLTRRNAWWKRP